VKQLFGILTGGKKTRRTYYLDVRFWHKADMAIALSDVRCRGKADLTPQRLNPLPVRNSARLRSAVPVVTNDGTIADACAFGDGLRRLPALHLPHNPLSTARRQPGILMHVHPVSPRNLKLAEACCTFSVLSRRP
jgi:hypothetical protein